MIATPSSPAVTAVDLNAIDQEITALNNEAVPLFEMRLEQAEA